MTTRSHLTDLMRNFELFLVLTLLFCSFLAEPQPLSEAEYQNEFLTFLKKHSKSYSSEDFEHRFSVFKENLDFIRKHNQQPSTYQVAVNKFADLTPEEFKLLYLGLKKPQQGIFESQNLIELDQRELDSLPSSYDWRKQEAVTAIKNQGQCGSCWAFSASGAVEGCHKLSSGKLVSLSEKNLMDCSWSFGNHGCGGGLMTYAFEYIIHNEGINSENLYPYNPASSHICKFNGNQVEATIGSFKEVKKGDEIGLLQAVATGPTSIAINAGQISFQFYHQGVYVEPMCDPDHLDHGVLAVGWGLLNETEYWIVKNSWGEDWGQEGYILMAKNKNNNCGIASMAAIPVDCS